MFFVLCCVTIALFGITFFLFQSFEQHREDLSRQWSKRGRIALEHNRATDAVNALRIALSYEPNDETNQLLLAQALAEAGRIDEATNYFLSLWDSRPGDGFINLQLARLARRKGDAQQAVNYYRASIFGNWEGDGTARRRDVRLELADYLASRGDLASARAELLIAAGNATPNEALEEEFGDRLQAVNDLPDALQMYKQALAKDRHSAALLDKAGRVSYALGDYGGAYKLLEEALDMRSHEPANEAQDAQIRALAEQARRIPELSLARTLPQDERAKHILLAAGIAKQRLDACVLQLNPPTTSNPANKTGVAVANTPGAAQPLLQGLQTQWAAEAKALNRRTLDQNAETEDQAAQLIDDTERQTAQVCGAPTGDDALLLMLASQPTGGAQ